jgi:hypothetical protein
MAEKYITQEPIAKEAARVINELCRAYGHPTPDATLERLLASASSVEVSQSEEIDRLRAALQWLEDKARARKIEIAPSLLGTGFEFGFWPSGSALVVPAKTLLEAVEAAQRA